MIKTSRLFYATRNAGITCVDGFSISVQAGEGYASKPKDDKGPWLAFEVSCRGYEEDLVPYGDADATNGLGVYSYVPKTVVESLIKKHGGLQSGQFPIGDPSAERNLGIKPRSNCKNCGNAVKPEQKFCVQCGSSL